MTVQILKLTNGDTLLTDVLDSDEKVLTIVNPIELITETNGRNATATLLAHQWLPLFEEENIMYLNQAHVVGVAKATEDMQEYYVSAITQILHPEKAEEERKEREYYLDQMLKVMANNNMEYH
jgi:hypothetical protein